MMTPDSTEPAPKRNRGNRRSGAVKGTHSGRRRGQMPWRKDSVIIDRVNLIRTLKAQGYTGGLMLAVVNEFMQSRKVPEVTLQTIYDDFGRMRELQAEERTYAIGIENDARGNHIEALEEVKRQAWTAFHGAKDSSLNRSAYLNTIRATVESEAKLDGSFVDRQELSGGSRPVVIQYLADDPVPPASGSSSDPR